MNEKKEPGVKEFLIYLVKKRILPKDAVARCRQRKQEALEKGYSLPVQTILLEQGYIASESEYQKLWDDMKEEYRIHTKIEAKTNSGEENIIVPEEMLEILLSKGKVDREDFPSIPTAVIEAANIQLGKKRKTRISDAARRMTQAFKGVHYAAIQNPRLTWLWGLMVISLIALTIAVGCHLWIWYGVPYSIQQIHLQIPPPSNQATKPQAGELQQKNLAEFRQLLEKEGFYKKK